MPGFRNTSEQRGGISIRVSVLCRSAEISLCIMKFTVCIYIFLMLKFHLNIFLFTNPVAWLLSEAHFRRGWGSSVGVATPYGLDCPGIEFPWGARFVAFVHIVSGAHSASYTTDTGYLLGVPPSSAESKGRVELCF